MDAPVMKMSDKAIATAQARKITSMDSSIEELVAHIKTLEKRINTLEKGAK